MEPAEQQSYGKLEWFFYIVILPVLFIAILTGILLWALDYDVKEKIYSALNRVPYIEKLVPSESNIPTQDQKVNNKNPELETQIKELKASLSEKNNSIQQLEQSITTKDVEIQKLNRQIVDLTKQVDEKKFSDQSREQDIANLAKIYTNMSPKSAANIISNLSNSEAVLILAQMNLDAKSQILEKMNPDKAADLSILLKDQAYSKDLDILALQERVNQLTQELDQLKKDQVEYQQLASTLSNMSPDKAAQTIISISNQNSNKARAILRVMDPLSRSKILNEMEPNIAAKLSIGLVN
ncbi:MotE family protein [Tepidibacillus infernus]